MRPLPLHQFAITDSRPCAFRPPSMAAGHFLLLVQEKVTKENTPSAPRRSLRERFATGERVRLTGHPWPESRIGAIPRAARVRCTRLFRPPFAASQREPEEQGRKTEAPDISTSHISDSLLLRQGLPRSALPGPSRPRRAGGGLVAKRSPAGCRRVRPQHMDVLWANPGACSRSRRGMDAPATAAARVPFSLVTFFWASKRKAILYFAYPNGYDLGGAA